jgi:EpsI family protein
MTMRSPSARLLRLAAVLAALSTWTHAQRMTLHIAAPDLERSVPARLGRWVGRPAPALDPGIAQVLAADQYVHRFYRAGGTWVEMDVAYYTRPRAGAVMHSPLNCLPGNGWQVMDTRTLPVDADLSVRRLLVGRGGQRVAMTYWFQNRGEAVAHEFGQRMLLLTNGLRGRPTDAAVVRVMSREDGTAGDALVDFTRRLAEVLQVTFR